MKEFCRDISFTIDNAAQVAEIAWTDLYFFDYKNGYQHVPIHEDSIKFFFNFLERSLLCFCCFSF